MHNKLMAGASALAMTLAAMSAEASGLLATGRFVLNAKIEVNALRQQRGPLIDQMEALAEAAEKENRDLSAAEKKTFDGLQAQLKGLDERIARAELLERQRLEAMKPVVQPGSKLILPAQFARGAAPRHFKGPTAREDAYKSGMWIAAAILKSPEAQAWCAEHGVPIMRAGREWFDNQDPARPRAALSTGVNTAGGFLVPTEFETAIIDLRETYGVFRRLARQVPMASDVKEEPRRVGGLTAYPVGENAGLTESEGSWDMVTLTARKWGVMTRWSTELNEDAIISMADNLAQEIAYAFAYAEDNAGFNGDGTSTYHGITGVRAKILASAAVGSASTVKFVAASGIDTFGEIDAATLAGVKALCPAYALPRAVWIVSSVGKTLCFDRLGLAAGGNTKTDLGSGPVDQYDGHQIVVAQAMPMSSGDLSDVIMLLFGVMDLGVMMGARRGIMIATSSERYFELDQLAIKGTERFDINHHTVTIKDPAGATAAGPIIGLEGE